MLAEMEIRGFKHVIKKLQIDIFKGCHVSTNEISP